MKRLIQVISLLIIGIILTVGCSNSTSSISEELTDGKFTASIENQNNFDGDASFEITVPSSEWFPDAYQDPVLFLTLKTGEIQDAQRGYTINTGLSLNSLWKENSSKFDLGSATFRNTFIHPSSLEMHNIRSGTIKIDKKSKDLLAGDFDLVAANSLGDEFTITGKFRAILSE
jgi:hypothetical protein